MYVPNIITATQKKKKKEGGGLLWYSHLCFNGCSLWKLRNAILSTIRGHLWIISFIKYARKQCNGGYCHCIQVIKFPGTKQGIQRHSRGLLSAPWILLFEWVNPWKAALTHQENVSHSLTTYLPIPIKEENKSCPSDYLLSPQLFWAKWICTTWEEWSWSCMWTVP